MSTLSPLCQSCAAPGFHPACPSCHRHVCVECRTLHRHVNDASVLQVGVLCAACATGAVSVPVGPIARAG